MYKSLISFLTIAVFAISCHSGKNLVNIQPKSGSIVIPEKGELRIWNNIKHSGFDVLLTNNSEKQSCDIYYVKSDGNEKWIKPSLMAQSSQTISIPVDGYLLLKNFNPNNLTITYKISE